MSSTSVSLHHDLFRPLLHEINSPTLSRINAALLPASINKPTASATSPPLTTPPSLPLARARIPAGASSCSAYRRLTFSPCAVKASNASGLKLAETFRLCAADDESVESWGAVGVANSRRARI